MSNEVLNIDDQTLVNIMNKRHRSAKSFKSPPQPKFCIKETLSDGSKDVFINVLSYSRIAKQMSEFDPVPLYGGIQIRSYNSIKNSFHIQQPTSPPPQQLPQQSTQLIFAVMASPEVLKKTGRNCPVTPEQSNLVDLMCEFVEAMNPGLTLSKKPEILKDRDLTGELKDIWSAVQNFREKEKSGDIVVYTEFGPETGTTPTSPIQKTIDHSIEALMASEQSQIDIDMPDNNTGDSILAEQTTIVESPAKTTGLESENLAIEKLSLSDKKSKTNNATTNINENESSEKNVKVQNQKNKESQHHFFPKFLTSSNKVKDDTTKDKDKEKEKHDDQETKVKTKKTLNFFRRNKSSTGSPTHHQNSNSDNNSSNNNLAAD